MVCLANHLKGCCLIANFTISGYFIVKSHFKEKTIGPNGIIHVKKSLIPNLDLRPDVIAVSTLPEM